MLLDSEAMSAMFRDFERSAFRLEVHQVYTVSGEQLGRYLAGEPMPAGFNEAWHRTIRANRVAGKVMQRVKIVVRPLSNYNRYSLAWAVPGNVDAGEEYRIIDRTDRAIDLPEQDFWLFDDKTVLHLHYDSDGHVVGRERVDDPDLDQYLRWKEIAVRESVPFAEYVRT